MRETDFLTHQGPTRIGTHGNPFATSPEPAPRTKRWTADEDAVMHEWYGQLSVREIRQRFLPQRSVAGICARAERLELTGATRNAWTAPELSNLKTFYGRLPITELIRDHLPRRSASATGLALLNTASSSASSQSATTLRSVSLPSGWCWPGQTHSRSSNALSTWYF